ncbi:MAG: KfrB domain-containing protein [Pseudomonadota bacterium]
MKLRLLVMNGQRLVQSEHDGQWNTEKVEKAAGVKPGIYNIHLSVTADKSKSHSGQFVFIDRKQVYQQVGKNFIKHDLADFDKVPEVGTNSSVKYNDGKATVSPSSIKLGRRI